MLRGLCCFKFYLIAFAWEFLFFVPTWKLIGNIGSRFRGLGILSLHLPKSQFLIFISVSISSSPSPSPSPSSPYSSLPHLPHRSNPGIVRRCRRNHLRPPFRLPGPGPGSQQTHGRHRSVSLICLKSRHATGTALSFYEGYGSFVQGTAGGAVVACY
jgi:hypothetical protein